MKWLSMERSKVVVRSLGSASFKSISRKSWMMPLSPPPWPFKSLESLPTSMVSSSLPNSRTWMMLESISASISPWVPMALK